MAKFIKLTGLHITLKDFERDESLLTITDEEKKKEYFQQLDEFSSNIDNYDIRRFPVAFNVDDISFFAKRSIFHRRYNGVIPDNLNLGSFVKIKKSEGADKNYRGYIPNEIVVEESVEQILLLIEATNE